MDGAPEASGGTPRLIPWSELIADSMRPDDVAAEADTIPPTSLACLIYTSGTGGAPKGVMLPHLAILSNCRGAFELVRPLQLKDEIYLSYLPISHSYEHTVGQIFLPSIGTEIVYARGVEHLAADMLTVRPTILTAVPRVLEVIRGRVLGQVAREKPWRQTLFNRAMAIGLKRVDRQTLSFIDDLLDWPLDRLVRAKVRARFGGRLVAAMSGGARLDPEVGRFYLALGVRIMQGYGQTEAGPVVSANPPFAIRIETVGPPLRGVEVRIAEDGEILVRGDLLMHGYWGRPADTDAAIRGGWLHTGDIGVQDADGYLRITDRKKDMIVLSGGENVSPARIETMLMAEPEIAQAVIAGEGRTGLSALLVPADGHDFDHRGAGGVAREHAAIGDRADPQARGGGAVHAGERAADADAEDPAPAGAAGSCGCAGGVALIPRAWGSSVAVAPRCACATGATCPLMTNSRRIPGRRSGGVRPRGGGPIRSVPHRLRRAEP